MISRKQDLSDAERVENLLVALYAPPDDDDPGDEDIREEAEAAGIDFEAWAASIRDKARAKLEQERRAREAAQRQARAQRARWAAAAVLAAAALAAAAVLALRARTPEPVPIAEDPTAAPIEPPSASPEPPAPEPRAPPPLAPATSAPDRAPASADPPAAATRQRDALRPNPLHRLAVLPGAAHPDSPDPMPARTFSWQSDDDQEHAAEIEADHLRWATVTDAYDDDRPYTAGTEQRQPIADFLAGGPAVRAPIAVLEEMVAAIGKPVRWMGPLRLQYAAEDGDLAALREELASGAALNALVRGKTALSAALEAEQLETAAALLEARADPKVRLAGGATALHVAARNAKASAWVGALRALLAAGADLGARERRGPDAPPRRAHRPPLQGGGGGARRPTAGR